MTQQKIPEETVEVQTPTAINMPTVFKIGNVKLTEFTNINGDIEYKSVKATKFYKDKSGNWKETNSFNSAELAKLRLLIEEYIRFNNPMNVEKVKPKNTGA